MQRFKLTIEYDGTPFVGWQSQANGRGVQDALQEAVFKFCGEEVRVGGAGRTDTGVHARGQVAHVDIARPTTADELRDALNAHLRPEPVSVLLAEAVPETFDARFSAIERRYLYRLIDRRAPLALERNRAWQVARVLDVAAMHQGAQHLVGRHDFTTFRASQCQALSPVKTLDEVAVTREGGEIHITARARSFLHNQVRSIVGTLKMVGEGRWAPDDVKRALEATDRSACGPVAPAHGLYLMQVIYPD